MSSSLVSASYTTYSSNDGAMNPYKSEISTIGSDYTTRVDTIVTRILQRGKDLNKDTYSVYLSNVSNGILGLIEKPAYKDNSEVRSISKYMVWELESTQSKVSSNEGFLEELMRIIEQSSSATPIVTPPVVPSEPIANTLVPAGSCYINFSFFANKNLYTVFGPGSSVADSVAWLDGNNVVKVGVNYYYKNRPGYKMSWRDTTTRNESYFVSCINGVLTGETASGGSSSAVVITATVPSAPIVTPPVVPSELQAKLNGACKIDYAFFDKRGVRHGGNLSTSSDVYTLNGIYNSFIYNNEVYMKNMPGRQHGWRDKVSGQEKMYVMCINGQLLEDGNNDKILYETPRVIASP